MSVMNVRQVVLNWRHQSPVGPTRNKGAVWRKKRVLGRLRLPPIPLTMLCSLILPAMLLASQAMALNVTYAYIPGFFVQDDPNADPTVIGAVSETRLLERIRG